MTKHALVLRIIVSIRKSKVQETAGSFLSFHSLIFVSDAFTFFVVYLYLRFVSSFSQRL